MSLKIRRVVTGHDDDGKTIVKIDEICKNVKSGRERHHSCVVWSTGVFPADNSNWEDGGQRKVGSTDPSGTVFRVVRYDPGVAPRNHRTDSIDYAVVISGAIDMEMDGTIVHLTQGDCLVQRGTVHNWINRGAEPCVIAFALIAAAPVKLKDKTLHAMG
ncbi:MAG TPA: cupin domain-containing protein [Micropepsaceae bacterium]|nr:cupin domain-containing protein [Micropepsaceae bacterium]